MTERKDNSRFTGIRFTLNNTPENSEGYKRKRFHKCHGLTIKYK